MKVIVDGFEESQFHVIATPSGDCVVWMARPAGEGVEWHSYALTREQACNLSRRLGTVAECENGHMSKRGA